MPVGELSADCEWVLPASLQQLASGGDAGLVAEILAIFQTETAVRLRALRHALESGKAAEVRREAHAIRGGALQVGAAAVVSACLSIERSAQTDTAPEIATLVTRLEECFHRVCAAMA